MHFYSKNSSTRATSSSLIMSELFPVYFFCSNNFDLSNKSSESGGKNNVFECSEAQ